jgi:hypothetical protein
MIDMIKKVIAYMVPRAVQVLTSIFSVFGAGLPAAAGAAGAGAGAAGAAAPPWSSCGKAVESARNATENIDTTSAR